MATKKTNPKQTAKNAKVASIKDSVQTLYSRTAPVLLFESVLFIILAAIIFIKPLQILTTLTFMFGIVLVIFGIYETLVGIFGEYKNKNVKTLTTIFGVINIIIGAVFCMHPSGSVVALLYLFAALFLFKSIQALIISIQMWGAKYGNYILNTFISIIMILMAVLILMFPGVGAVTAMYYIAGILLFYAFADLYMYAQLLKLKKKTK